MRNSRSIEYSCFDVDNPLPSLAPLKEEEYVDRYLFIGLKPNTLKIRDDKTLRYKEKVGPLKGCDIFQNYQFHIHPEEAALNSFLQLYQFGPLVQQKGIVVAKQRRVYKINNSSVYFSSFSINTQQHTNLTISGRSPGNIKRLLQELGIAESNKSFAEFLRPYVR